jgi:hypothetical protein
LSPSSSSNARPNGESVRAFCVEALRLLGADVADEPGGQVSVTVPPSSLDLFDGRESLQLAFAPNQMQDGAELVVPGSYVLEQLLKAVRMHGEVASIDLEPAAQASPSPGLELANAEARLVSSETHSRNLLMANFRVSLVSDEDQDRLFSVAIDCVTGKRSDISADGLSDIAGTRGAVNPAVVDLLKPAFSAAESEAMDFARDWAESAQQNADRKIASEIERLNGYYRDVLADAGGGNRDADVRKAQLYRKKAAEAYDQVARRYDLAIDLVTSAQSVQALNSGYGHRMSALTKRRSKFQWSADRYASMAECDREIAALRKAFDLASRAFKPLAKADAVAELERDRKEALAKLEQKSQARESTKFSPETIEQLKELGGQLDSEKAQRIAELQEKFHIKMTVTPVSASLVRYPQAVYSYTAVSGSGAVAFESSQDLITHELHGPACQSCGGAMPTGYACACGHLVCPACHKVCAGCGKDVCGKCVTATCQFCGGVICDHCRRTCEVCGKIGCPSHVTECPCCGKSVCMEHSGTCVVCGQRVCLSCLNPHGVCATCAGLFPATSSASAIQELLPKDFKPGRWLINESRTAFTLVRTGITVQAYVIDKVGGRLMSKNALGPLASMRARLRLLTNERAGN